MNSLVRQTRKEREKEYWSTEEEDKVTTKSMSIDKKQVDPGTLGTTLSNPRGWNETAMIFQTDIILHSDLQARRHSPFIRRSRIPLTIDIGPMKYRSFKHYIFSPTLI